VSRTVRESLAPVRAPPPGGFALVRDHSIYIAAAQAHSPAFDRKQEIQFTVV
jgi:hypothetical protein